MNEVGHFAKCIRMLAYLGRLKRLAAFACLKERICKKIKGYKEKRLSNTRKKVLIKVVA